MRDAHRRYRAIKAELLPALPTAQTALLAQLQPHVPPDATVIFLGDGEFDGTALQQTLADYGGHSTCRTAVTTVIWCGDTPVHFRAMGVQEDEIVFEESSVSGAGRCYRSRARKQARSPDVTT